MLELSTHDIDLGNLDKNTQKSFQITVKNNSNLPVTPSVTVSCGCTTPTLEPAVVPANGNAQLLAKFDTTGKSGFQSKNIYISYNENGAPMKLTLNFKAIVDA